MSQTPLRRSAMRFAATLPAFVVSLLALFALFGIATPAQAQMGAGYGYGRIYGTAEPPVGLNFIDIDPSSVHSPGPGESGSLQTQEWRAFGMVPVYGRGTDTVWSAGLAAEHLSLRFTGFSPTVTPTLIPDLYGESVLANVFHRIDPDHSWSAFLSGGLYSNSWPTQGGGRVSGGGVYDFRVNPSLLLGVGGALTYVFGEARAVPILALAYREGPWSVNVRLPFRADVRYALAEKVRVGAEYFVQGGEFNVTDSSVVDTVRYSSQMVGALLAVGPFSGLLFQLDAGKTVARNYTARNDGDTVESLNFDDALYYRGSVIWRW